MNGEGSPGRRRVLLLGGPGAGKTTYLVQLHGRVSTGRSVLRARGAAASLTPIEAAYYQLQQGHAVAHTAHGTAVALTLPVVDGAGQELDIVVPDYAGEDLVRAVTERTITTRWRDEAMAGDHWVLLVRVARHPVLPDILTRPIGELAWHAVEDDPQEPDSLPGDMLAVELLQALLYVRHREPDAPVRLPRLTLALSCWGELALLDGTSPDEVAAERLPLLHSYCRATWYDRYRVLGLSAQGRPLDDDEPASEYVDLGPEQMGWIVTQDGTKEPDLTVVVEPG